MAVRDVKELNVYISKQVHKRITSSISETGKMLRSMHDRPEKFLIPNP